MKVAVVGLWHQGAVTAAALAAAGHEVVAIDDDAARLAKLRRGEAPVYEPGLDALIERSLAAGRLQFSSTLAQGCAGAQILWVAHDTPIADGVRGLARTDLLAQEIGRALREAPPGVAVVISAQLPVGSVGRLERACVLDTGRAPNVAYVPENLRLGTAVRDFLQPDRWVVGTRDPSMRGLLEKLLQPIGAPIVWMSVESAEMTKHALNAFFATSVAFTNEIAALCESTGADASEVERGLKTDARIGARAYVSPGAAFAGGTLARDVGYLRRTAAEHGVPAMLLEAVLASNREHANWARRKLHDAYPDLSTLTIAVWGLTYKPGTDTLRDSPSIALCEWLLAQGARIRVHDPAVKELPEHLRGALARFEDPAAAVAGADALIVATDWPIYRSIDVDRLGIGPQGLLVLDANRFLPALGKAPRVRRYVAVGMPHE
jgi:UDPglucose 6-dehydrogenase